MSSIFKRKVTMKEEPPPPVSRPMSTMSLKPHGTSSMPDPEMVEQMYADLLEETLVPPAVRSRLIDTQSLEKKWNFVQIHHRASTGTSSSNAVSFYSKHKSKARSLHWGERERALLARIANSQNPDIQSLLSLKVLLSSANKEILNAFLQADGVAVLLKAVLTRTKHKHMEEVDAAVLYEILLCCKLVLNNSVGMKGFLSVSGSIDAIALALRFEFKHLALLVLEILSAICFTEAYTHMVLHGVRLLARTHNETALAGLANAMLTQDVEMKTAVLRFVNCLLLGVSAEVYAQIRSDLALCAFDVKCEQALQQVEDELDLVENSADVPSGVNSPMNLHSMQNIQRAHSTTTPITTRSLLAHPRAPTVNTTPTSNGKDGNKKSTNNNKNNSNSDNSVTNDGKSPKGKGKTLEQKESIYNFPSVDEQETAPMTAVGMDAIYNTPEPSNIIETSPMMDNPFRSPPSFHTPSHTGNTATLLHAQTQYNTPVQQPGVVKTPRLTPRKVVNIDKLEADKQLIALAGVRASSMKGENLLMSPVARDARERERNRSKPFQLSWRQQSSRREGELITAVSTASVVHTLPTHTSSSSLPRSLLPRSLSSLLSKGRHKEKEKEKGNKDKDSSNNTNDSNSVVTAERHWYSLSEDSLLLRRHEGEDARSPAQTVLSIAAIADVRASCSDLTLLDLAQKHKFAVLEIILANDTEDVFCFACSNSVERDAWMAALQAARQAIVISKSTYFTLQTFLELRAALQYAEQFKKLYTEYCAFMMEEKAFTISNNTTAPGLDLDDISSVFSFLNHELTSCGTSEKLLYVLRELLCVPASSDALWDAIYSGIRNVRRLARRGSSALNEAFPETTIRDVLAEKAESEGTAYKQMSRLAFAVMAAEKEIKILKGQLADAHALMGQPLSSMQSAQGSNTPAVELTHTRAQVMELQGLVKRLQSERDELQKQCDDLQKRLAHAMAHPPQQASTQAAVPQRPADPRFEKYEKMRKMLPEGAVRQKMQMEGISEQEIDDYFSGKLAAIFVASPEAVPTQPVVTVPVDPRFEKYEKMRKMLPEGAVRQKMQMEGISEQEIDDYFSGKLAAMAPASTQSVVTVPVDPRFEKYEKMRKMLPEGAVRQKMQMEGISEQEIEDYFSGKLTTTATQSVVTVPVDPRFEKYEKMRKMLPEGAVRQKMKMEGISEQEIDDYFSGKLVAKVESSSSDAPSAPAKPADPRLEKFDKMRKMLPEGAVRQKMKMEGFTDQEIDVYFGVAPPPAAQNAPTPPAVMDPKFEKFVKMRKMLPEGAVRQKMAMEGISPEEIDGFFGAGSATASNTSAKNGAAKVTLALPPKPPKSGEPGPSFKLKNLFWNKIPEDGVPGTFWSVSAVTVKLREKERKSLEDWFPAKAPAAKEKESEKSKKRESARFISVLDAKRTQNVLIALGKLRRDPEELLAMVMLLDPAVLTPEITQTLIGILPTAEEAAAFKEYSTADRMDAASRLFFHLCRVPRLTLRMECHDLVFSWFSFADDLATSLDVMRKALWELSDAQGKLEAIFALILSVGNYLNHGTKFGDAVAVKFDTLSKCATLKATDAAQGSLLNYLALWVASERVELLSYSEGWIGIWAAADLSFKQVLTDLSQCEQQVQRLVAEQKRLTTSMELTGLDHKPEAATGPCCGPLLQRLNYFLEEAQPRLADLQLTAREIEHDLERAMARYGEHYKKSDDDPAKRFFGQLVTFTRNFLTAHEHNVRRQKAAEKAARLAAEAAQKLEQKNNRISLAMNTPRPQMPDVNSSKSEMRARRISSLSLSLSMSVDSRDKDNEREIRPAHKEAEKEKEKDNINSSSTDSAPLTPTTPSAPSNVDNVDGNEAMKSPRTRSSEDGEESIFGRFYSLEAAAPDQIMEKFRKKLQKSMRFSLSPPRPNLQLSARRASLPAEEMKG